LQYSPLISLTCHVANCTADSPELPEASIQSGAESQQVKDCVQFKISGEVV
jgi:hypothetical protein